MRVQICVFPPSVVGEVAIFHHDLNKLRVTNLNSGYYRWRQHMQTHLMQSSATRVPEDKVKCQFSVPGWVGIKYPGCKNSPRNFINQDFFQISFISSYSGIVESVLWNMKCKWSQSNLSCMQISRPSLQWAGKSNPLLVCETSVVAI